VHGHANVPWMGASMTRRGILVAGAAVLGSAAWQPRALAAGARSGAWCKAVHGGNLECKLYELTDDDSKVVFDLDSFYGSPMWLMFFTSWCPPGNSEAADIVKMANDYRAEGVKVLGISVKEKPEPVHAYVTRHAIDFPIALDSTGSVFKALGGEEYPSHMFLDSAGNVTCIALGMLKRSQMDNEIAVAIAASARYASSAAPK
jgi:peroxiredoxin